MPNLYLFYQGSDASGGGLGGSLWYQAFDGTNWLGVRQVPNVGLSCAPSPVVFNGVLQVLFQGAYEDGQLWTSWYDGNTWNGNVQVPNLGMSFSPGAVVFNNKLYVFHNGLGETGALWYTVADGISWSQDRNLVLGGSSVPESGISLSPSAVVWNNTLYVFFQNGQGGGGIGNPGYGGLYYIASSDGINWEGVTSDGLTYGIEVANVGMSFSPSAVAFNGVLQVFHEGLGQNGQLWTCWYNGTTWHPDEQVPGVVIDSPPDPRQGTGVDPMSPAAVVYNGQCYVFYLNLDYNLSYKVADGTSWSQEMQVPNGVPNQCGYVGCVVF
jgi:hypothetical protein